MFNTILKKYEKFKKDHIQEQEHISRLIKQEIEYLTKHYLQVHNRRIIDLHKTEQNIEAKNKAIAGKYQQVEEVASQWMAVYNSINGALKDVGDLVNYSEFIEKELDEVLIGKRERAQTEKTEETVTVEKKEQEQQPQQESNVENAKETKEQEKILEESLPEESDLQVQEVVEDKEETAKTEEVAANEEVLTTEDVQKTQEVEKAEQTVEVQLQGSKE